MLDWLTLENAKLFSGPAATVLASLVAAIFAFAQWSVARAQARTAKTQANIAHDKLKHDLFERRYAIYAKLKRLVENLLSTDSLNRRAEIYDDCVDSAMEAEFFFDEATTAYISHVIAECHNYRIHFINIIDIIEHEEKVRYDAAIKNSKLIAKMIGIYFELPKNFSESISFHYIIKA